MSALRYRDAKIPGWIAVVGENRRVMGEIRPVPGGYQYVVRGSKMRGDVMPTVAAVKQSLEAE